MNGEQVRQKDWTGNKKSQFTTLGATNHTDHERAEYDFYATDPVAAELLCAEETFKGSIWENCCGKGHLSQRLKMLGYDVISTDIVDRGYGKGGIDFFKCTEALAPNIATNPPYAYAKEWVEHSLDLLPCGGKLALFLPIQFLESEKRRKIFQETPPKTVYVCTNRILCGINGNFYAKDKQGNIVLNKDGTPKKMSSARCYAWFIWVKGEYGDTKIKWIN